MLPPWKVFPQMAEASLGWSMGPGAFYWIEFNGWYGGMSPADRKRFQRENAEPASWAGFYGRLQTSISRPNLKRRLVLAAAA